MVYLGPLVCGFVNARITIPCKKPSRLPLAFRHVSLESGLSICLLTLKRQQLWSLDLEEETSQMHGSLEEEGEEESQ